MNFMTDASGAGALILTAKEMQQFKKGKPITHRVGSSQGECVITAKLTCPRERIKRFPPNIYGEGYQPPREEKGK